MATLNAAARRAPAHRRRLASLKGRAEHEWVAFRPAAIVVAVFAAIVLVDGLVSIGLFGLLEVLGLRELPIDPKSVPADAGLPIGRIVRAAPALPRN